MSPNFPASSHLIYALPGDCASRSLSVSALSLLHVHVRAPSLCGFLRESRLQTGHPAPEALVFRRWSDPRAVAHLATILRASFHLCITSVLSPRLLVFLSFHTSSLYRFFPSLGCHAILAQHIGLSLHCVLRHSRFRVSHALSFPLSFYTVLVSVLHCYALASRLLRKLVQSGCPYRPAWPACKASCVAGRRTCRLRMGLPRCLG